MPVTTNIGLPDLTQDDVQRLAEECEGEVVRFIYSMIPEKSIAELVVSCTLDLDEILTMDLEIDISQKYSTGHSLDEVIEQAADHAHDWLEKRLLEMKRR